MRTKHQQRIEEMMTKAGQDRPPAPVIPNEDIRRLRAMLILEEALETCEALGFRLTYENSTPIIEAVKSGTFVYAPTEPNLEEIADGCADISVVTIGTLSACGIDDEPLLEEVDKNNLQKFGEGGYRNEHGKWCKPAGHKPPDIVKILKEQGYDPSVKT